MKYCINRKADYKKDIILNVNLRALYRNYGCYFCGTHLTIHVQTHVTLIVLIFPYRYRIDAEKIVCEYWYKLHFALFLP